MPISRLDHVNIRTTNLQGMIDFYQGILGLRLGPRPAFAFPGAWIYCEDEAVVHLVGVDEQPEPGKLRLEHFAFKGNDKADFLRRLDREGIAYRIGEAPGFGITQVNIYDPDGNHIHVDFKHAEET